MFSPSRILSEFFVPRVAPQRQDAFTRPSPLKLASNPEYRLCGRSLRKAIPKAVRGIEKARIGEHWLNAYGTLTAHLFLGGARLGLLIVVQHIVNGANNNQQNKN
jgi:hypothetical protein